MADANKPTLAELAIQSLPEPEFRPPKFLSRQEQMLDVYQRVYGRVSPRTKELLKGPDLADWLSLLEKLQSQDTLLRNNEAKLLAKIAAFLPKDSGPLLQGLHDPRLFEPWRLFFEGWNLWLADEKKQSGVELFWEGEAEDDNAQILQIQQSLSTIDGELRLYTCINAMQDILVFDGQVFYRLQADREPTQTGHNSPLRG